MKLRENEFSLGEFDHLYINFTTCDIGEETFMSDKVDTYHLWYRYCLAHIEKDIYNKLGSLESYDYIIQQVSNILVTYFSSQEFDEARILSCIHTALEQGENMLMKLKEKLTQIHMEKQIHMDYFQIYLHLHILDMVGNIQQQLLNAKWHLIFYNHVLE